MKGLSAMRLRSDGSEERELTREREENKDVIVIRRIDKEMNSVERYEGMRCYERGM